MQLRAIPPALATLQAAVAAGVASPAPPDLLATFARVPDPRRRQGTRFPLAAVLTVAVAALLSNHLSVLAMAEWVAAQSPDLVQSLGLVHGSTPHQSTLQRLFRKLDPAGLSQALSHGFAPPSPAVAPPSRGGQGVALDGKAHRGRLAFTTDATGCPVHMLSAVSHDDDLVLAQVPITVAADKAEGELTVAPALIARLTWHGRVMTGDALFCQRNLCEQVLKAGGDYLIIVKANQPTLFDDLQLLFDPPHPTLPLTDRREAQSRDNGHGRHDEVRRLVASTDLMGYSDWPGLVQAFRWERQWREHAPKPPEVLYGITSLPPECANAAQLLQLKRGHWCIENGLHYVKDVTMGEDRSLIHVQHGPNIVAMLRDAALNLLRRTGQQAIARSLRYHSSHPEVAVSLVRGQNA